MDEYNEKEDWRPIRGYEDYVINPLGQVKRLARVIITKQGPRRRDAFILSARRVINGGKRIVTLFNDKSVPSTFFVHRLVAEAFLGVSRDDHSVCVIHKDDQKNDHYQNLQVTSDQFAYNRRSGRERTVQDSRFVNSKGEPCTGTICFTGKPVKCVDRQGNITLFSSRLEAAEFFKISSRRLTHILNNSKQHGEYQLTAYDKAKYMKDLLNSHK